MNPIRRVRLGGNNGQITGITDNVQSGRTVSYTYDSLHRLKTAVTTGSAPYPQWGLSWTYDRYGNRTAQTRTHGTTAPENSVTVSTSTNRITQMGPFTFYYDANGNLTADDLYQYKYDGENRLVEIRTVTGGLKGTYAYDGNSLRVIKVVGADRTWYLYSATQVISEFEDAASNTYNPGTTPGQMGSDSLSAMLYQHPDHLTTRLTTDNNGDVANQQGHYPFGEIWYNVGTADPSVLRKFTTYEKETEVSAGQLHYAVYREHGARVGRFHMADPVPGRARNPQTWNRYAYVAGDPTNRTDPLGLNVEYWWCPASEGDCGGFWTDSGGGGVGVRSGFGPAALEAFPRGLARHESIITTGYDPELEMFWGTYEATITLPDGSTITVTLINPTLGQIDAQVQQAYQAQFTFVLCFPPENCAPQQPLPWGLRALKRAGNITSPVADPRYIAAFYLASAVPGLAYQMPFGAGLSAAQTYLYANPQLWIHTMEFLEAFGPGAPAGIGGAGYLLFQLGSKAYEWLGDR